jgi:hypothetical protein
MRRGTKEAEEFFASLVGKRRQFTVFYVLD